MDHGMTNDEVAATPVGTQLHFTNWPGRASVPVKLLNAHGLVKWTTGMERELYAFADELSREPRAGLGE